MPALRNERHEVFAQACAAGKSASAAYRSAGYQCAPHKARGHGHRLRTREDIAARIDELSTKALARTAAQQVAEGTRRGAPTLYRPELAELGRRLALLGATDQEMADALGIDQVTLDRWKTRRKEFRGAIEQGKIQADAEIAQSLFNRARGYRHEATKIFMPAGSEAPVYAPYVKYYPPDTNAALAWLSRRQPDRWKERQQVDISGTLEHRLNQMTPEERAADALELVARVRRRLAEYRQTIEHEPEPAPEDQPEAEPEEPGVAGRTSGLRGG
jgi:hypothetical protein